MAEWPEDPAPGEIRPSSPLPGAFLLQILEHVAHAIFVKDRSYRFVFVNRALCELIGRPAQEVLGGTDYDFFSAEQADHFRRTDEELFRHGTTVTIEEPITDAAGAPHVLSTTKVPLRDEGGALTHLVGIIHDISQLKGIEDTLRRSNERLHELDRLKSEFLANVSHEFRTPLTLNLAPLQEMMDEPRSPLDRERLRILYRNGLRLLHLVDNLLEFARLEAGRVEPTYAATDLGALTQQLCERFTRAFARNHVAFRFTDSFSASQGGGGARPYVDLGLWEDIVFNLLANALKFTEHGEVTVALLCEADDLLLRVSDTGIGIPAAELPHLFTRFHRVAAPATRAYEGAGIGLALVAESARLHGGSVAVASQVGQGTTFTVRLPLGCAHLPAGRVRETALLGVERERWGALCMEEEAPPQALSAGPDQAAAQALILVIDDNPDMRFYLPHLLAPFGRVITAANGEEGLALIRGAAGGARPDLVLADVMMPRIAGLELCQRLKADAATADLPVILLTARAEVEERVRGLDSGADDYILKPFSPRELQARVRLQLQLAAARKQIRAYTGNLELLLEEKIGEVQRHVSRLEEADRLKDEFLSVASHELRTPLGSIQLLLGLFRRHLRDAPQVNESLLSLLDREERLVQRLNRLITDILDVSRIKLGKLSVTPRPMDFSALVTLVSDTAERCRGTVGARHHIILRSAGDQPLRVMADPDRLDQVLSNLLANACKYTPAGSTVELVVCAPVPEGREVEVQVRDSGPGIARELHERIFERFYQIEAAAGRAFGGLGLGLYISRELIAAHGGRIWVESAPEHGSVFHFTVPLAVAPGES